MKLDLCSIEFTSLEQAKISLRTGWGMIVIANSGGPVEMWSSPLKLSERCANSNLRRIATSAKGLLSYKSKKEILIVTNQKGEIKIENY